MNKKIGPEDFKKVVSTKGGMTPTPKMDPLTKKICDTIETTVDRLDDLDKATATNIDQLSKNDIDLNERLKKVEYIIRKLLGVDNEK